MLYTFVLTVALILSNGSPFEKDVHLTVELPEGHSAHITPMECQLFGGIEVKKWIEENPGYTVVKWRCPPPGKLDQDANNDKKNRA